MDQNANADDPVASLRRGEGLDPNSSQKQHVEEFLRNMDYLSTQRHGQSTYELISRMESAFGISRHFKQTPEVSQNNDEADQALVIEMLRETALRFQQPDGFLDYCKRKRTLEEEEDKRADGKRNKGDGGEILGDAVHVMTIHKAKGKEWGGVVLFHLELRKHKEGNGNSSRSGREPSYDEEKKKEEEERRVAYVSVTRAKEAIWVTAERGKMSPFVTELFSDPKFEDSPDKRLNQEIEHLKKSLARSREKKRVLGNPLPEAEIQHLRENSEDLKTQANGTRQRLEQLRLSRGHIARFLWNLGIKPKLARELAQKALDLEDQAIASDQEAHKQVALITRHQELTGRIVKDDEALERAERELKFRDMLNPSDPRPFS